MTDCVTCGDANVILNAAGERQQTARYYEWCGTLLNVRTPEQHDPVHKRFYRDRVQSCVLPLNYRRNVHTDDKKLPHHDFIKCFYHWKLEKTIIED